MKLHKIFATAFAALALATGTANAQDENVPDSTGLPGDNFSLEAALELFKKASSPEDFEKALNTETNKVNNLDLNEDGNIDYIKVINRRDGEVQIFVLQVVISETEYQDIAVIELEKTGTDKAVLQIIGDEDIYGDETIVEPNDEAGSTAFLMPGFSNGTDALDFAHSFDAGFANRLGASTSSEDGELISSGPSYTFPAPASANRIIVNVWGWPVVRFVYAPGYRAWQSPWAWAARPTWWRPWRPIAVVAYRPYRYQYRQRYVVAPVRKVVRARVIYRPARVSSVTVRTRNQVAVNNYRTTRTTKSVTVNRGNKQYKATKKTTTVQGNRGSISRSRTTVRRKRN